MARSGQKEASRLTLASRTIGKKKRKIITKKSRSTWKSGAAMTSDFGSPPLPSSYIMARLHWAFANPYKDDNPGQFWEIT
jgi:hypothetical protein